MNNNLPEVVAAWEAYQAKLDLKMSAASGEIALRLEGAAKHMIVGDRKNSDYPAVSGKPPMNVTGHLRDSIEGNSKRIGFNVYEAIVGAGMVYARAVEIGAPYNPPSWRNGQHFPFIQPAVKNFIQTGMITRILIKHLGAR